LRSSGLASDHARSRLDDGGGYLVLTEKVTIILGLDSSMVYKNKLCADPYRSK
jgi:hypothetical protein